MKTINLKTGNLSVRVFVIFTMMLAVMALVVFSAFDKTEKKELAQNEPQGLQVEVSHPIFEKITEWDEYTGRFEASNRVEVRARVSGYIENVSFKDGQDVTKGDVLFTIDQRPFKIALNQARAGYGQALANLTTAQDNFNRVRSLRESGAVSLEEYDHRQQALAGAKATLQLAQAAVDNAKLNLEFTRVKAPISGRVSRDMVNEGNLIDGGSSNSTLLTTIVATSPIHFYFRGSESDYLKYSRLAQNGERGSSRSTANPVLLKLQDEADYTHEAVMDFVDNEIDRSTGTIEGRATLDNEDGLIEPGMFGKARLLGSAEHEAIMIPDEIIGTNQSVRFVYVLGADNTVTTKNIELGPLHTNGLRIIRNGLTVEDKLITNNIQKIRPGVAVRPIEKSPIATKEAFAIASTE
ncbi:efflux RND transporter periplasmic adaptor subunit [Muricauda sp. SCSIO 64092]|uniref:efflux RND transporter periplasmic adaptor subunit n=1 Tax=Allomuricauda sp. SCSIO 64092 TaxID=2908842 RepID=UPI001FF6AAFE|nr:efflux RND transporter periplasmic adaptor subunit [Muricauda sp. SCSIO 64092]UOY05364.1 efflux RND transporter periplasmic adaptor subunit [Muricauda sp. SCSIO 64092]